MARTRSGTNYLPEEIVFIIFLLLPIKKLLQLKSVCKSWRFMISSTRFIRTHLTDSHKKRAVLLDYMPDFAREINKDITVHCTSQDSYRLYLPPTVTVISYIFSCDGLVCLSNYDCDVTYLWNPSTKHFKMLPAPNKNLSNFQVFLGLGFASIFREYKLLRIGFKSNPGTEAELYSSKTKSWKEIRIPQTLQNFVVRYSKVVHAKPGILYLDGREEILAFDLHKEVFRRYRIPGNAMSNVLDFEGYVAMVIESGDGSVPSLFVLNDVCGTVSWTKLFDLDLKIGKVIRYLGMREFLVQMDDDRFTYFYDYQTRETKKCNLKWTSNRMSAVIKYTESLVSVNGFEQQDLCGK